MREESREERGEGGEDTEGIESRREGRSTREGIEERWETREGKLEIWGGARGRGVRQGRGGRPGKIGEERGSNSEGRS